MVIPLFLRTVYDSAQPKAYCSTSCGNVSIEFPFGTEAGCFRNLDMYLTCLPGPSGPILKMPDGSVITGISIDEGTLNVLKPTDSSHSMSGMGTDLYSYSEEWGVVKWTLVNATCKDAMTSKEGYGCFSNSACVDVTDDKTLKQVGYRCKCSPGFEGNPYLKDGCTGTIFASFGKNATSHFERIYNVNPHIMLQILTSVCSRINTSVMVFAKILLRAIHARLVLMDQISITSQGNAGLLL